MIEEKNKVDISMEELNKLGSGSDFVRADLHIHSFGRGGSFDVKDNQMTPENIIDSSIENDLSIISITDHNEISNSETALRYSEDKNILLIPGIEVSTTQGHLLVYFETFTSLRKFYGKLNVSDDKKRCTQGIVECLNFAKEFNGIGVLAHIELDSGFEKTIGRFSDVMKDIFNHPSLYALEISKKSSSNFYTDVDENSDRKNLVQSRRKALNLSDDDVLPKIMSSDSHTLDRLGTNAEGANRLTRVKVDALNFSALKNALISHESRIRLEDLIPHRIPFISGIKLKGGILDTESVMFSKNLTCIIGGRGTGKSTLLETIRETSGNGSTAKIVDSEVWPDEIDLFFEDETGGKTHFKREKNSYSFNTSDSENGISRIAIESYGQGETADTIQHSDENPQVLLDFLDDFIDVEMLIEEDTEIRASLLDNQSELNKARVEIKTIPDIKKQITNLEGKKKRLEKESVGDLVKYQSSLITERNIRDTLIKELKELIETYKEVLNDDATFEHFSNMSNENIVIGIEEFDKVKTIIEEFSKIVSSKSEELNLSLKEKVNELSTQLKSWKSKESDIQKTIDAKKEELTAQGIPFDIGKINQIAKDLDHYKSRLRKLEDIEKKRKKLEQQRKHFLSERKKIKSSIYNQRLAFSLKINKNLNNSVDGLSVSSKFSEGCYSPSFDITLKNLMEWRTSQVPKSKLISESISPLDFAEKVKNNNLDELKKITDDDGNRVFTDIEIANILKKTLKNNDYEEFEALEFEDKPKLTVTKLIKEDTGKTTRLTRTLACLSLGQQQSILLAILLHSNSTNPLLIDQPEDNLDSEFIYKTIVNNLRKIKEKRQVIIVTHNPNIAVLGDAELILPLKSSSVRTHIVNRGSIDRKEIRDLCCEILEGGKQAFINRQKLYGISPK